MLKRYRVTATAFAPGKGQFEYSEVIQTVPLSAAVMLAESNLRILHNSQLA